MTSAEIEGDQRILKYKPITTAGECAAKTASIRDGVNHATRDHSRGKRSAHMSVFWFCQCGFACKDAHSAFLHRGTDAQHDLRPLTRDEALEQDLDLPFDGSGIERHFAMEPVLVKRR